MIYMLSNIVLNSYLKINKTTRKENYTLKKKIKQKGIAIRTSKNFRHKIKTSRIE